MTEPFVMRPAIGTLTLGGSDFHCQVVAAVSTSEQSENSVEAMCGTVTTYGEPRYFLDVDFFQDWRTGGISKYLWDAAVNATVAATYSPDDDGSPLLSGNVVLKKPAMGGVPRQGARDRVRLAWTAQPTLTLDT